MQIDCFNRTEKWTVLSTKMWSQCQQKCCHNSLCCVCAHVCTHVVHCVQHLCNCKNTRLNNIIIQLCNSCVNTQHGWRHVCAQCVHTVTNCVTHDAHCVQPPCTRKNTHLNNIIIIVWTAVVVGKMSVTTVCTTCVTQFVTVCTHCVHCVQQPYTHKNTRLNNNIIQLCNSCVNTKHGWRHVCAQCVHTVTNCVTHDAHCVQPPCTRKNTHLNNIIIIVWTAVVVGKMSVTTVCTTCVTQFVTVCTHCVHSVHTVCTCKFT